MAEKAPSTQEVYAHAHHICRRLNYPIISTSLFQQLILPTVTYRSPFVYSFQVLPQGDPGVVALLRTNTVLGFNHSVWLGSGVLAEKGGRGLQVQLTIRRCSGAVPFSHHYPAMTHAGSGSGRHTLSWWAPTPRKVRLELGRRQTSQNILLIQHILMFSILPTPTQVI